MRDDDLAALEHLRPLERPREELQLRELDVLVDALEDAVDVGARLDEIGREPQRLRRRVRVLEAARVGDERDVERLGDLGRDATPTSWNTSASTSPVDEASGR